MSAKIDPGFNGDGWRKVGWTLRYPELGTAPVSYANAISPEFYELEREAIFRRRWLNVGHVSDVPAVGSYFTREIEVCSTSIIVTRGKDNVIRAFHNICPHRGNKLQWSESPALECSGTTRMFRCRYHGWSFDLEGKCQKVTDDQAFFDLDREKLGLKAVHCSVWKGWIFVNFSEKPSESLEASMGEIGAGMGNFPFEQLTTQYKYVTDVKCNWKVVEDAFLETYHSAYLHGPVRSDIEHGQVLNHALHFYADSKGNRLGSYYGSPDNSYRSPVQKAFNTDLFGPLDYPDFGYHTMQDLPIGINPTRHPKWGIDQVMFHPNFQLLMWHRNWVVVHRFWPLSFDRTRYDMDLCFVPPKNASQRVAQELQRVTLKDFVFQDLNLLGGTFQMLQSRAITDFQVGDEEFMVRHLHATVAKEVDEYKASLKQPAEACK
jgi:phenylpropionate dioxygenase-like ring-hydroxylating dioxygenase large terminal subunit